MKNVTVKLPASRNPVDLHVGTQVLKRRKELGITQSDLAQTVELTFQQIQKYERGSNRISASKLHEIARRLNVPIAYFFKDLPDLETDGMLTKEVSTASFLKNTEGQELAASFARLSPSKRKGVMTLVRSIVNDNDQMD